MDGICVLAGTVCDLAGNRSYARRNLCVNRFGSVYDLSQDADTLAIISGYYTDASTPFIVTEYNVSPLTEWQVTLYRNGIGRNGEPEHRRYEVHIPDRSIRFSGGRDL